MSKLSLWNFLEEDANSTYLKTIEDAGGRTDRHASEALVRPFTNIGDYQEKIMQWMLDNKDTCHIISFKDDEAYSESYNAGFSKQQQLPNSVGYGEHNTTEYDWGLTPDVSDELKELFGGRETFEKMNVNYDTGLQVRMLVYMPGQMCPLHVDMYQSWKDEYKHLNPRTIQEPELIAAVKEDINNKYTMGERNVCDLGKVLRRLVTVTDWQWGHFFQIENAFWPKWSAGDVFDVPTCIYHLSANAGVTLKITLLVTGVELHGH